MSRKLRLLVAILAAAAQAIGVARAEEALTYFAPGNIQPDSTLGVQGRKVSFPDWVFPLEVGAATGRRAYIGTQLSRYHGVDWVNDPRLFNYPHRDNQCEPRQWTMQPCPAGAGHQGVDIRAHDNRENVWPVVAVEAGVVTSVTPSTAVIIRSGDHSVRYLHMDPGSIAAAGIRPGVSVAQGQQIGKVSCILGGRCQTSRHLHFDAFTGSAGQGNFYHVYPSLIAAYRRAWNLPDKVVDGALARDPEHEVGAAPQVRPITPSVEPPAEPSCDGVALAEPLAGVDRDGFSSLWRHNCSIMGLVADRVSGARTFVYYRPKKTIEAAVAGEPSLFEGVNQGGRFSGTAKQYSRACGIRRFAAEGAALDAPGATIIRLGGRREALDSDCRSSGTVEETLEFSFVETVTPQRGGVEHVVPAQRTTFSELTRNFLAITFYPDAQGRIAVLPYFASFQGYTAAGGMIDSSGGLIPALLTDEAGVAISLVWVRKRARFTQGELITPRTIAHSMAGVDPSACDAQVFPTVDGVAAAGGDAARAAKVCDRVVAYLRGYIGFAGGRGFATSYFGRRVGPDETLNLADGDTAWNWMRTMYSHESGREPVIGREIFQRGVKLGDDYIATFFDGAPAATLRPLTFYSDPCNFAQPSCDASLAAGAASVNASSPAPAIPTDDDRWAEVASELADMRARLGQVEAAVKSLGGAK